MIATMKAGQQALGRVHYPRHFSMSRYSIPLIPFQFLLATGAATYVL